VITTLAPVTSRALDAEGAVSAAVLRTFRRNLLHLQQDQLADKLLVELWTYRAWEQGRRPLTRFPVYQLHALTRALAEQGVPQSLLGALDAAVELDCDITRALASKENLFPPPGRTDTWLALLRWALSGSTPLMFMGLRNVQAPRICSRDQRILMLRAGWECGG